MGELAAISASALWAVSSLMFADLASKNMSALAMNVLKCAIGLALMVVTLLLMEGAWWPEGLSDLELLYLSISGFIGLTVGDTAFFHSLIRLGARRALLFTALVPLVTTLLAVPILGESVTLVKVIGMTLTMGGVIWVIMERPPTKEETHLHPGLTRSELIGIAFAMLAVACQSGGNILTKLGGESVSALGISVVRLSVGVVGLAIVVAFTRSVRDLIVPFRSRHDAVRVFVASLLGCYLGIWLLNMALKYAYAGVAATLTSTAPIWVLPIAYFMYGERTSARAVVGACVAVAGVALLFLAR